MSTKQKLILCAAVAICLALLCIGQYASAAGFCLAFAWGRWMA